MRWQHFVGISKRGMMDRSQETQTTLLDFEPSTEIFFDDVVRGLFGRPKSLPCKYFYDQRGSELFDEICELDEYYLTRTELEIMARFADEMARQIGHDAMLVEYGSGSSVKTRILLDHLPHLAAYVPVDISREHLESTARELVCLYPQLEVLPVCADFTGDFKLPQLDHGSKRCIAYFPGSTIGNFSPEAARNLLSRIAQRCGRRGGLILGIDLQKDVRIMEAAYDDEAGVTAEFNLNLLHRINRELNADFVVDQFEHVAKYNERRGRVEMFLVSQRDQVVTVGVVPIEFSDGEMVCTEYSHKYTIEGIAHIARTAGFSLQQSWMDDDQYFAVLHLSLLDS